MISHSLQFVITPHEYDTVLGRRIQKMKADALAKAAEPIVNYFFQMLAEFGDGEGVEKFECYISHDAFRLKDDKSPDLYDLACSLEDLGAEFCANVVGLKIKRTDATNVIVTFAKRTDPAPRTSPFNSVPE